MLPSVPAAGQAVAIQRGNAAAVLGTSSPMDNVITVSDFLFRAVFRGTAVLLKDYILTC